MSSSVEKEAYKLKRIVEIFSCLEHEAKEWAAIKIANIIGNNVVIEEISSSRLAEIMALSYCVGYSKGMEAYEVLIKEINTREEVQHDPNRA